MSDQIRQLERALQTGRKTSPRRLKRGSRGASVSAMSFDDGGSVELRYEGEAGTDIALEMEWSRVGLSESSELDAEVEAFTTKVGSQIRPPLPPQMVNDPNQKPTVDPNSELRSRLNGGGETDQIESRDKPGQTIRQHREVRPPVQQRPPPQDEMRDMHDCTTDDSNRKPTRDPAAEKEMQQLMDQPQQRAGKPPERIEKTAAKAIGGLASSKDVEDQRFAEDLQAILAGIDSGTLQTPDNRDSTDFPTAQSADKKKETKADDEKKEDEDPHAVFDKMNMAYARPFNAGVIDVAGDFDHIEQALEESRRPARRVGSSLSERAAEPSNGGGYRQHARSMNDMDVVEDLALISDLSGAQQEDPKKGTSDEEEAPAEKRYTAASGVVLPADIEEKFAKIADAYYAATSSDLYITSGTRTASSQASAMHTKLAGGSTLSEYKNQTAAQAIKKAYDDGVAGKKGEDAIIADMTAVIQSQIDEGTYISKHLIAGAVDVRSKTMNDDQKQAFRDAVATVEGVSVLLETTPPHWHLQF